MIGQRDIFTEMYGCQVQLNDVSLSIQFQK